MANGPSPPDSPGSGAWAAQPGFHILKREVKPASQVPPAAGCAAWVPGSDSDYVSDSGSDSDSDFGSDSDSVSDSVSDLKILISRF